MSLHFVDKRGDGAGTRVDGLFRPVQVKNVVIKIHIYDGTAMFFNRCFNHVQKNGVIHIGISIFPLANPQRFNSFSMMDSRCMC